MTTLNITDMAKKKSNTLIYLAAGGLLAWLLFRKKKADNPAVDDTAEPARITLVETYEKDGEVTVKVHYSDGSVWKNYNENMSEDLNKEVVAFCDNGGDCLNYMWDEEVQTWI